MSTRITILGAGAWGRALGTCFENAGHKTTYWRRGDPSNALHGAKIVIAAVPAQATREVLSELVPALPLDVPLVLTAKGLETGSNLRQSEIARSICPRAPIAVLSGPSFAADLDRGLPTAVTLASKWSHADTLQSTLATPALRPYLTDDLTGAELGGALKNVIAIAAGAAIGARLGESARAATIARGFAEIVRIGIAAGASRDTMMGLSGLGDLTLTCTSSKSRNFSFGVRLGAEGQTQPNATTEGRLTARAAANMATGLDVDTPLINTIADVVDGRLGVRKAVEALISRPLRRE
ncbi:MAG: NAD(P)H-dependent glycerol-3-phosphate dehydrogenase [Paracoccaceae bacterium]